MFIPFSPSIIILAVLALFVVIILFKTALVVPNKQAVVVERLGKFHAVLYAGFHILIPFIDTVAEGRSSGCAQTDMHYKR